MMQSMVESAVLQGTYLVTGLAESKVAKVAALGEMRSYASGQVICTIGEIAAEMYVVLDGNVFVMTADGDRLGEIGRGSVIGEIALVDARPRTANVVCVGPVNVAVFSTDELRKLMNADRDLGFTMLASIARVLAGRLRQADARIDELTDKASDVWHNAMG
jgi:CRP-like cAMP-binding protein